MQPGLFTQPEALSVTDLTRYIRDVFELDYRLQDVWVQGEISNLSRPSSGHVYFSLKDSGASIRCVMWKTAAATQASKLREGDAIIAHGKISVYEPQGAYQLYVDAVQAAGAGDLFQQFELLKAKLQAEGLFDLDRKRPLPEAAHTIGIVTSPTGAALQDMLNIIRRRWPLMKIVLASTPVQGDDAPVKIIAALKQLYRRTDLDAIIVARGGGSIEDLWAFNDENVARTIVQSPVPVISGVGHEVDFTIADFVADVRAPTPSAAAELITPDQAETRSMLQSYSYTMTSLLTSRLQNDRMILNSQVRALQHLSPRVKLSNARQRIDDLLASLQESMAHDLELQREKISSLSAQLSALNPLNVLARGYAVVRIEPSGQIVRSRKQIKPQQPLSIRVRDGEFDATSKG
jgi:exodeoxyribonuclease VII large subunit